MRPPSSIASDLIAAYHNQTRTDWRDVWERVIAAAQAEARAAGRAEALTCGEEHALSLLELVSSADANFRAAEERARAATARLEAAQKYRTSSIRHAWFSATTAPGPVGPCVCNECEDGRAYLTRDALTPPAASPSFAEMAARVRPIPTTALASGEPAAAEPREPVCSTCNDTHLMSRGDGFVPCTRCPTPCQRCRAGGTGAFCESTPCACACHGPRGEEDK